MAGHDTVSEWNRTTTAYPRNSSVPALFGEWARRTPDAPALRRGDADLSYRQLDECSDEVAYRLLALALVPEDRVGLFVRSAADWVVGALAVLKAGGAYLPLDPAYPPERLAYMCRDAGVRSTLTVGDLADRLPDFCGTPLVLEDAAQVPRPALPAIGPDRLAYVMYTSGSTGRPKGVAVTHRGIVRLVRETDYVDVRPTDTVAQASNISFDAATYEAWGALLNGARLVGLAREDVLVPDRLAVELREHHVDVLLLTTSLARQLVFEAPGTFASVRHLTFGGEQADRRVVALLREHCPATDIRNAYGPTEGTTITTTYRCTDLDDPAAVVPIGYPIANTWTYVLDDDLDPVPLGTVGELYVGGDGLARGYLDQPGLTADRFVPDPFAAVPGGRLYRTGDLVRRRGDGALEFVGRRDQQVKVRGFRVEPGEVEESLRASGLVREVVVRVVREDDGEARLVAYVVPDDGAAVAAVRAHAQRDLPEHLVPDTFVPLPRLPLAPNGKVDTDALPSPRRAGGDRDRVIPRTPAEVTLAGIWCAVLGLDAAGVDDDFFELGGRSLQATRVRSRLSAALGVDVPLRLVLGHRRLGALAAAAGALADRPAVPAPPPAPPPAVPGLAPLTRAQRRMWVLAQLRPDSPVYTVPFRFTLIGALDVPALRRALVDVVARHDALRTEFVVVDGEPRQRVVPLRPDAVPLHVHDDADALERVADDEARRPFALTAAPLVRAAVVRTGADRWTLLLTLHHIVCDGASMRILWDDLAHAYAARRAGTVPVLPAARGYAQVAHRQDQAPGGEGLLAYWSEALAGAPRTLDLLTDRPRPPDPGHDGDEVRFTWPAEVAGQVAAVAQQRNATPFVVLLAACHALLFRHTHQRDIVVGTPVAGRTRLESEQVVGLFVNTLALRARLDGNLTFGQLVDQLRDTTFEALAHQELPFDAVVEHLAGDRDPSSHPLFGVMVAVDDGEAERLELAGLEVTGEERHTGTAKFDLTFVLTPHADRVDGRVEYRTPLFDRTSAVRLADHLRTLLAAALEEPDRMLGDLPLMTADEQRAVSGWSASRPPGQDTTPVHHLVDAVADATPDAPALSDEGTTLTYRETTERAHRLAGLLRARGVTAETPVAVCLPSCPDLVVAFLAVLGAGGMYVPLDPALPPERQRLLLADSGAALVLTDTAGASRLPATAAPVVVLDRGDPVARSAPVRTAARPDGAAYLVYTSGSTGLPKGVVVTHRSLRNLADAQRDLLGVRPEDRVLQFHSPGFDVSISDMVTALTGGAELLLVPSHRRQPGPDLERTLREHAVTVADLPPVVLGLMDAAALPDLRCLTVGGERCPADVAATWSRHREFYNAYGPTETAVTATAARVTGPAPTIPIGRPLAGVRTYVLDQRLEPVPAGVAGQLFIGGAGVARGYLGDAALTARGFVPDPFAGHGARMYATGDVVRYAADGALEFLGRADSQIKIRGHRIELGEIEARLGACPGVRHCAVVVREDRPGDPRLVGYVVGDGVTADDLRRELRTHLPGYLVPAAFVVVDALRMTASGKLDVAALPAPGRDVGAACAPPRSRTEQAVAAVWRDVLGVEEVGIHDNFFDLGGNSLLLLKARVRLEEVLGVEIPAVELFRHPTVALLARYLAPPAAARTEPGGRTARPRDALAARGRRRREERPA